MPNPARLSSIALILLGGCAAQDIVHHLVVGAAPGTTVAVRIEVNAGLDFDELVLEECDGEWALRGHIHVHGGTTALAHGLRLRVEARDRDGRLAYSHEGEASVRRVTSRHLGRSQASFELPVPAPEEYEELVLSRVF